MIKPFIKKEIIVQNDNKGQVVTFLGRDLNPFHSIEAFDVVTKQRN